MNAAYQIEVLTLFPELLEGPLSVSILGKARESGRLDVTLTNIRDYAEGRHKVCDDTPYGGGAGMVMKPEPLTESIEAARARVPEGAKSAVVLLTPGGRVFDQPRARALAELDHLILVCGRYEGVDERIMGLIDEELSIGDFVLTGGEPAALVVIDAVTRLRPGVLGNAESAEDESFETGLLEYPHYTRPAKYRGQTVPEVLRSGDHAKIERWRREQSLLRTAERRPDLLETADLTDEDRLFLEEVLAKSDHNR